MAWIHLLIAGLFEIGFALSARYAEGFTRFWPTMGAVAMGVAGLFFLSLALRTIPFGTAYAVWTGIGIVSTTLTGILMFGESLDGWRILFIVLIMAGIIGLRMVTPAA